METAIQNPLAQVFESIQITSRLVENPLGKTSFESVEFVPRLN